MTLNSLKKYFIVFISETIHDIYYYSATVCTYHHSHLTGAEEAELNRSRTTTRDANTARKGSSINKSCDVYIY